MKPMQRAVALLLFLLLLLPMHGVAAEGEQGESAPVSQVAEGSVRKENEAESSAAHVSA